MLTHTSSYHADQTSLCSRLSQVFFFKNDNSIAVSNNRSHTHHIYLTSHTAKLKDSCGGFIYVFISLLVELLLLLLALQALEFPH